VSKTVKINDSELKLSAPKETFPRASEKMSLDLQAFTGNLNDPFTADQLRDLIPPEVAWKYKIVPLQDRTDAIVIGIENPEDIATIDEISWLLQRDVIPVRADRDWIEDTLKNLYGLGANTVGMLLAKEDQMECLDLAYASGSDIETDTEEASIIQFVNQLLLQAIRERSTDIHIEPFENHLRIRYRVDGILYEFPVPDSLKQLHQAIVSRIKVMANLNIAEQRLPQDGRIKVRTRHQELDIRISILPTPYGETVNMRILSNNQMLLNLEKLGLLSADLARIERLIQKPHGIILVTGPTGSGKTTTLYACLNRLNHTERKIITIEDPIEYQLPGITQVQVNPNVGLTFAQGLRSMLRHDPDVMLVGEIRDRETAEVTIQVAMTGHLVFSTLHTNDAPSAVARLVNMGIEPYLIAASVECVIAQRLVRVICPHCKTIEIGTNGQRELLERFLGKDAVAYRGKGCGHCRYSGYLGRTAIYEFFLIDDEMREHIVTMTPTNKLRKLALQKGMISLRKDGLEKAKRGITTLEEVLRVTQEVEE